MTPEGATSEYLLAALQGTAFTALVLGVFWRSLRRDLAAMREERDRYRRLYDEQRDAHAALAEKCARVSRILADREIP